jgi:hypothetical protein
MDVSRSGLGLLVERTDLPRRGDTLNVRLQPGQDPVCYEVVRVPPGASRLHLVGCQRMVGRSAQIDLPDRPRKTKHAA